MELPPLDYVRHKKHGREDFLHEDVYRKQLFCPRTEPNYVFKVVKKMFNDKNIAYKGIIDKADGGNPAAMFELAMLYDSNAIEYSSAAEPPVR